MVIAGIDPSIRGTGITIFKLNVEYGIESAHYFFFTQKKKDLSLGKASHIKGILIEDKENDVSRNDSIVTDITNIMIDYNVDSAAIEDYAMGIKSGRVFAIGEFCGLIKHYLFLNHIPFRVYDIPSIKIFASGKGNADKEGMLLAYKMKEKNQELLIQEKAISPMSDLIDSYYIAKMLKIELALRAGHVELKNLPDEQRAIFLRTTKGNPVNILSKSWNE